MAAEASSPPALRPGPRSSLEGLGTRGMAPGATWACARGKPGASRPGLRSPLPACPRLSPAISLDTASPEPQALHDKAPVSGALPSCARVPWPRAAGAPRHTVISSSLLSNTWSLSRRSPPRPAHGWPARGAERRGAATPACEGSWTLGSLVRGSWAQLERAVVGVSVLRNKKDQTRRAARCPFPKAPLRGPEQVTAGDTLVSRGARQPSPWGPCEHPTWPADPLLPPSPAGHSDRSWPRPQVSPLLHCGPPPLLALPARHSPPSAVEAPRSPPTSFAAGMQAPDKLGRPDAHPMPPGRRTWRPPQDLGVEGSAAASRLGHQGRTPLPGRPAVVARWLA